MAPIQFKFLKSTNSLIVLLISILGFSSSGKESGQEYGTPHATFIIFGKIESATTKTEISDIIVEVRETKLVATGYSRSSRGYDVAVEDFPSNHTYKIKFTDTDGVLNGEYETLDTTVVFNDPKFTDGDGSWFAGYTEQELNIKLKPKK